MLQIVLAGTALLACMYLVYIISWQVREIIKAKMNGIPFIYQPLGLAPFKIPLIAEHVYLENFEHIKDLYSKLNPRHKYLKEIAGTVTSFRLANPQDIKSLVISKASKTTKPSENYEFLRFIGESILSASANAEWKIHRHIAGPAFDEAHLKYMAMTCNQAVDLLVNRMEKQNRMLGSSNNAYQNSLLIDPYKEFADVTMDIIGKAAFGYDLQVLADTPRPLYGAHTMRFKDALETSVSSVLTMRIVFPRLLHCLFNKNMRAIQEVQMYIQDIIAERKRTTSGSKSEQEHDGALVDEHNDLLSLLLKTNESSDEKYKLSEKDLIANAWVVLFAGHDTTSTALQWLSFELAQRPDIQDALRKEIELVIGKSTEPTYDDTKNLVFMRRVINENLRKNQPVGLIFKENGEELELSDGKKVPAHSTIVIDIHSVHHDADIWPEPNSFKPERFEQQPAPCTFMPFSTGPRSCIGANFSLAEQAIIMTRLLQKYKFELPEGFDPSTVTMIQAGAVQKPSDNLRIVLKPLAECL